MPIRLLESIRIAGSPVAAGVVVTSLSESEEAALISRGVAVDASPVPLPVQAFARHPCVRNPRAMLFGDSRVAREWLTTAGTESSAMGYGWLTHANVLSGYKWPIAYNYAVSGYTTAQAKALLPEALAAARTCGWVFVSLGTNDIYADSLAASAFWPALRDMLDALCDTGAIVVMLGETPRNFIDAGKVVQQMHLNHLYRNFAATRSNAIFFDAARALVNPNSTQFAAVAGVLDGAVHFNNEGARRVGALWNAEFGHLAWSTVDLIASAADAVGVNASSAQLFANPMFTGANASAGAQFTATAGGAAPTGSLPNNVQVDHAVAGSADCVCSSPARADGIGDNVRVVIGGVTPAVLNDRWEIRNTGNMTAGVSPGDLIQFAVDVRVSSHVNLNGLSALLQMQTDSGAIQYAYALRHDTNNVIYNAALAGGIQLTRPVRVPSGASLTAMQWRVQARFGTAGGSATVDVGRPSVLNLTRLGLAS